MDHEIVDIAGTKMLILLHLIIVMVVGGFMLLAGFLVGRYGRRRFKS